MLKKKQLPVYFWPFIGVLSPNLNICFLGPPCRQLHDELYHWTPKTREAEEILEKIIPA